MTMAFFALSDNLAAGDIEGREQSSGAMADIIMSDSFNITQPHGQHRLCAVKGLNLAFFVYTQDHGVVGGIEVESDDIADFFDEEGIVGELEMALAVRRNTEGVPDAVDGGFGDSGLTGYRAATPVSAGFWLGIDGFVDHGCHLFIGDRAGPSGSEFVMEPLDTLFYKTPAPFDDRSGGESEFFCDNLIALSIGGQKHNLGASDQAMWHGVRVSQSLYLLVLLFTDNDSFSGASSWHKYPPTFLQEYTIHQRISKVIYGTLR